MPTTDHTNWMHRCLQLASLGAGSAAPNPMVGAVLVKDDRILAEGWHHAFGGPHAEVECLRAFGDRPIPSDAVLYVNLEPCAHHGKTPPCAELLVERGVKHVVIGQRDPFPGVAGKGIAILEAANVQVTEHVLHAECRWHQRRFLTSIEQGRPYIILKWARSMDGLLDRHPRNERGVQRISNATTDLIAHGWRSVEQAILVGSRTVLNDDPSLTVRHLDGVHPLRVVLDRKGTTPVDSAVYSKAAPTLLFTTAPRSDLQVDQVSLTENEEPISRMLSTLHTRGIRSVIVEGGAELLGHFIRSGIWDEARVITGAVHFGQGTPAPLLDTSPSMMIRSGTDRIDHFLNGSSPAVGGMTYSTAWRW